MFIPPDVKHPKTLDGYGLDPTDPMMDFPVSFDISVSSYGSFWRFLGAGGFPLWRWFFASLGKISYDYKVFSGRATDVFGAFIPFPFRPYFLWFTSFGDTVVDYSINNTDQIITTEGERQYIKLLSADGFRVRNLKAGDNTQYQLVIFR